MWTNAITRTIHAMEMQHVQIPTAHLVVVVNLVSLAMDMSVKV